MQFQILSRVEISALFEVRHVIRPLRMRLHCIFLSFLEILRLKRKLYLPTPNESGCSVWCSNSITLPYHARIIAVKSNITISHLERSCGNPGTPTNGIKTGTNHSYGASIQFACNAGYTLQGSQQRTCQNTGQWSGSQPTCQSESLIFYLLSSGRQWIHAR